MHVPCTHLQLVCLSALLFRQNNLFSTCCTVQQCKMPKKGSGLCVCHANFCTFSQHLVSVYLTQRALAAIGYGHTSGGLVRSAKPVRVLIFDPEKLDFPFQSLVFHTTLPKLCSVHKTRAEAKTLECRSDISHRHLDTCLVTIRNFHLCAKCQKRVFKFTKARLDRRHYEVRSQYKQ